MREVKYKDGEEEKVVVIKKPTPAIWRQANKYANGRVTEAIKNRDVLPQAALTNFLKENNIIDDDYQKRLDSLTKDVEKLTEKIDGGGYSVNQAKDDAFELFNKRLELVEMLNVFSEYQEITVDGYKENCQFDYLCYSCFFDEEGELVFDSPEECINNSDKEWVQESAIELRDLVYNNNEDTTKNLPEVQFLLKYKFIDDKYRRINKEGKLVDKEGRLVDDKGRLINEDDQLIDEKGHPVDEDGKRLDTKPFLDEDGNPV